ncbi:hypothetical protein CEE44_05175 [Candidatus Woesearchaeota archaeon B3_Woes]|nr:MAG: hypothetical protein CEE44_05175 [Candidatus Woesearchaeota archaeon B3_Woes]
MYKKVLIVFTVIRKATLEKSLNYLVCPSDKADLRLNIGNSDLISEGEFQCNECGRTYEIKDGVPYFFEKGNGSEWKDNLTDNTIIEDIAETISDKDITWSKIIALSPLFLNNVKDRRKAIDKIFGIVGKIIRLCDVNSETEAYLTQAAIAARYDIEVYKGTFKLPEEALSYLKNNYRKRQGIIVEGACATGDCLLELEETLDSRFYIGLDISGTMVRKAQQNIKENVLFVQGDVTSLPLKRNSAGIYVLNNLFDRVVDPPKTCEEADLILRSAKQSFLVLSNCDPLQFGYTTEKGDKIIFVPENKQLTLEEGLEKAGFNRRVMEQGMWQIETAAYGREALPYKCLVGSRPTLDEFCLRNIGGI